VGTIYLLSLGGAGLGWLADLILLRRLLFPAAAPGAPGAGLVQQLRQGGKAAASAVKKQVAARSAARHQRYQRGLGGEDEGDEEYGGEDGEPPSVAMHGANGDVPLAVLHAPAGAALGLDMEAPAAAPASARGGAAAGGAGETSESDAVVEHSPPPGDAGAGAGAGAGAWRGE
jgi:hypothetical protein